MRFIFPKSHAYPGGRLDVEDDGGKGPECLVTFSDGTTVIGVWRPAEDGGALSVPAYRTAKGAEVVAREWRIVRDSGGAWRARRG